MWLLSFVIWLSSMLMVFSQNLEEEGLRCYDCNSFNPHCRDRVNQSDPTEGFAVFTHCPKTQRCFIRKDQDGVIVRGCADGWRFSLVDIEYLGCKEQTADWLGPQVWCFCDEDLCNQVPMAQLNRGEYLHMSESSEYLSVNQDLDVEHELTGWKGMELLEKQLASEEDDEAVDDKTTTTHRSTTTKAVKKTTQGSVFTSKPKNATKISTHKSTTLRATTPKEKSNSTTTKSDLRTTSAKTNKPTTTQDKTSTTKSSTFKATPTTTPKVKPTSKVTTTTPTRMTTKSTTTTKAKTTQKTSQRYRQSTTRGTSKRTTTTTTLSTKPSTTQLATKPTTVKTTTTQVTEKADLPWWLWHIVSSTPVTTKSTTTAPPTTATQKPGGRRRTYLKPKVKLVTKRPSGGKSKDTNLDSSVTSPAPEGERWTWSPSWWDKWWRPNGTRRQRRPKRPSVKYPRRPRPTQGRGHYWWLAPVGPTDSKYWTKNTLYTTKKYSLDSNTYHPESRKFSAHTNKFSPSTKRFPATTKKIYFSTKKPTFSTKKQTMSSKKTQPSYPQHIIPTSTPEPIRMYPKFPNWGRRLTNPKKSIYPVMTTKKPRPTTRAMVRRRPMKTTSYSTRRHASTTAQKRKTTKLPYSTVRVTQRRRKPTSSRRRIYPKNRPKPETQQKESENFFCWDCYSASTNCRDVVNSPYSYYVGRTPCPYTRKCFVRKDNGVIYRGCADGWTSSLIDRGYNGCKVQYTWGRPVEWCFCDTHLCNGQSLNHIKNMYSTHNTDKNAILDLPSRDFHRKKDARFNQLR